MKLLLDEHYARRVAAALRERGHDALAVTEVEELRGLPHEALFAHAKREHRVILTQDVGDFVVLAREAALTGVDHFGLIFASARSFPRATAEIGALIDALDELLASHAAEDALLNDVHWLRRPAR